MYKNHSHFDDGGILPRNISFGKEVDGLIEAAVNAAAAAYKAHVNGEHPGSGCDGCRAVILAKIAGAVGAGPKVMERAVAMSREWLTERLKPYLSAVYTYPKGTALLRDALLAAGVSEEIMEGLVILCAIVGAAQTRSDPNRKSTEAEARAACLEIGKIAAASRGAAPAAGPGRDPIDFMFMRRGPEGPN
jgi:hypothetical protein